MRGIEFRYREGYGHIISDLLQNIPIKKYDWYNSDDEIIKDNDNYWVSADMNGDELRRAFWNMEYLVILITIQAYPKGSKTQKIVTYEDFMNSSCEIILLISDCTLIEIYSKDKNLILQFIENAEQCGCTEITIKTDKDDSRTRMSVM